MKNVKKKLKFLTTIPRKKYLILAIAGVMLFILAFLFLYLAPIAYSILHLDNDRDPHPLRTAALYYVCLFFAHFFIAIIILSLLLPFCIYFKRKINIIGLYTLITILLQIPIILGAMSLFFPTTTNGIDIDRLIKGGGFLPIYDFLFLRFIFIPFSPFESLLHVLMKYSNLFSFIPLMVTSLIGGGIYFPFIISKYQKTFPD